MESYGGVGIHMFLTTLRSFPGYFQNAVFLSVAVLDSENFKGTEEVDELEASTRRMLSRYVDLARRIGVPATAAFATGTDVVSEAEKLCERIAAEYPRNLFVGGKLVFEREHWFDRLLHNETAFAIQRRLSGRGTR